MTLHAPIALSFLTKPPAPVHQELHLQESEALAEYANAGSGTCIVLLG